MGIHRHLLVKFICSWYVPVHVIVPRRNGVIDTSYTRGEPFSKADHDSTKIKTKATREGTPLIGKYFIPCHLPRPRDSLLGLTSLDHASAKPQFTKVLAVLVRVNGVVKYEL